MMTKRRQKLVFCPKSWYNIGVKKIMPSLDADFEPLIERYRDFCARVSEAPHKPLMLCVYRKKSCVRFRTEIFAEPCEENNFIVERIAKSMLWSAGGFRLYVAGDRAVFESLRAQYAADGPRAFDASLMSRIYERPFEVICCEISEVPAMMTAERPAGGYFEGCRIGFDAGGSDRKVIAMRDGEVVFSEEVEWLPKVQKDPEYLLDGVRQAIASAAKHLPRVDGIGVSSAGICVGNKLMESSLFRGVPEEVRGKLRTVYIDVAEKYGAPLVVANDGDVTALAGGLNRGRRGILGIALGTSEASGYLTKDGSLSGWISELSSVPIDVGKSAQRDSWTGDFGCGGRYLSQEGVLRLAARAGIELHAETKAGKLKEIQRRADAGDVCALEAFRNVGIYLGYAIAFYALFYEIDEVLLLGRVMSGKGGEVLAAQARSVLAQYPECAFCVRIPDETERRMGQAYAAATMPRTVS